MGSVQSIERAFAVLDAIAASEAGLTEISRQVGMPKSTVARIINTLVGIGALDRISPGASYRIGPSVIRLSAERSRIDRLTSVARPHLQMLASELGEDAGLSVPDGDRVHYVAQEDAENNIVVRDWTGTLIPLHVVPSGLVILAHWPREQLRSYLAGKLPAYTPHTVTDPHLIRRRLAAVRRDRSAWVLDEFVEGISSVASPVYDRRLRVVGALHVHGPSYRFPGTGDRDVIASQVLDTAQRVSSAIGRPRHG